MPQQNRKSNNSGIDDFIKSLKDSQKNNRISCSKIFDLMGDGDLTPGEVGEILNKQGIKISHCQCGLFGFPPPDKKRIKPLKSMPNGLEEALTEAVYDGAVPCVDVWKIAKKLQITRMEAAGGCENLELRISPCQLGSF